MSFFDVDLNIMTLLKGERKVDEPIHKPEFYKPLTFESISKAINTLKNILERYK